MAAGDSQTFSGGRVHLHTFLADSVDISDGFGKLLCAPILTSRLCLLKAAAQHDLQVAGSPKLIHFDS